MKAFFLVSALAAAITACGDKPVERATPTTPDAPAPQCRADQDCTDGWTPSHNGCGPIERCFGGQCLQPPAISGERNAETGRIIFETADGEVSFDVEVVDNPFETARGLMCRREMLDDWGMLFFMRAEKVQRFWMKNTLISLDLLFLDRDWRVVGVVEAAEPRTLDGRGVDAPSRYVLELTAGRARRAGIDAGSQARYEGPR